MQSPESRTSNEPFRQESDPGPPETSYDSKLVMLRAERGDCIEIVDTITVICQETPVPGQIVVQRRSNPYFGPKIEASTEDREYRLTAPGPDTELLLWAANETGSDTYYGWNKVAEVSASLSEDQSQYDLCPECNRPLRTLDHEQLAAVGECDRLKR